MMTNAELAAALRRIAPETGSLVCLGCGHEHNSRAQLRNPRMCPTARGGGAHQAHGQAAA
nr:MAG TPA: transcription factor [Caudoviricetes sp.]